MKKPWQEFCDSLLWMLQSLFSPSMNEVNTGFRIRCFTMEYNLISDTPDRVKDNNNWASELKIKILVLGLGLQATFIQFMIYWGWIPFVLMASCEPNQTAWAKLHSKMWFRRTWWSLQKQHESSVYISGHQKQFSGKHLTVDFPSKVYNLRL